MIAPGLPRPHARTAGKKSHRQGFRELTCSRRRNWRRCEFLGLAPGGNPVGKLGRIELSGGLLELVPALASQPADDLAILHRFSGSPALAVATEG